MKVAWFEVRAPFKSAVRVLVAGGRVVTQQGGNLPAAWPGTPWHVLRSGMERVGWEVSQLEELPQ